MHTEDLDRIMHLHVIGRICNLGLMVFARNLYLAQRRRVERSAVAAAEWKLCK